MDAGNISFAPLIVGQLVSGQSFRWDLAGLGLIALAGFYTASYFVLRWRRRD